MFRLNLSLEYRQMVQYRSQKQLKQQKLLLQLQWNCLLRQEYMLLNNQKHYIMEQYQRQDYLLLELILLMQKQQKVKRELKYLHRSLYQKFLLNLYYSIYDHQPRELQAYLIDHYNYQQLLQQLNLRCWLYRLYPNEKLNMFLLSLLREYHHMVSYNMVLNLVTKQLHMLLQPLYHLKYL